MPDEDMHGQAMIGARQAAELVEQISVLLLGHDPEVQGATLAQLFAKYIAGHAPELRESAKALVVDCADSLVPIEIEEWIELRRVPPEWRKGTKQ